MKKIDFFTRERSTKNSAENLILHPDFKKVQTLAYCSTRKARQVLPLALAQKYQVLPLHLEQQQDCGVLTILCQKNLSLSNKQELAFCCGVKINWMEVDTPSLRPAIDRAYQGDQEDLLAAKVELLGNGNVLPSKINLSYQSQAANPESIFLKKLIDYALAKEASDIHIIPKVQGTFLKVRIDGELFEHPEQICTLSQHQIIINRLKVLAKLNISEQRLPQDGAINLSSEQHYQKLRLSIMPTIYGEKAVLRLPKNEAVPALSELGLDNFSYHKIQHCLEQQAGLIILCGPTGSGKTTTIYSALKELSNKNLCLASIEDPVEIFLPNVDQTSIKPEINFDYQHALKNILRQDPDVLLIGEIRDRPSADIAMQAALSGHLIFSSVHAGSVQQAISRLQHLNLDRGLLSEALKLIINQRLVPALCQNCKEWATERHRFNFQPFCAKGCQLCNYVGYKERILLAETLHVNYTISQQIAEKNFSVNNIAAKAQYYRSYKKYLKELLVKGMIDLHTYRKYQNE